MPHVFQLACAIEYILKLDTSAEEEQEARVDASGLSDILAFVGGGGGESPQRTNAV